MSQVAVLIPARVRGDEHRQRALAYVLEHYQRHHPHWQVSVADPKDPERWRKGEAVSRARHGLSADVFVVTDADVFTDPAALEHVVSESYESSYQWGMPHGRVWRLDHASTERLYSTGELDQPKLVRGAYHGAEGGGLVVVRADAYDACPMDPRFHGWGGEDLAWGQALRALYGEPARSDAILWHLWHEHAGEFGQTKNADQGCRELARRYWRARKDPAKMRALLGEVVG